MTDSKDNLSIQQVHSLLKSLMNQNKILEMFFYFDKNGVQTLRIRGKGVEAFDYPLTSEGYDWIYNYLNNYEFDDTIIDYNDLLTSEGQSLDAMQKETFKMVVKEDKGKIIQDDKLKDEKGRFIVHMKFPLGTMHFFMIPDEDIINYMKSKGLKIEDEN